MRRPNVQRGRQRPARVTGWKGCIYGQYGEGGGLQQAKGVSGFISKGLTVRIVNASFNVAIGAGASRRIVSLSAAEYKWPAFVEHVAAAVQPPLQTQFDRFVAREIGKASRPVVPTYHHSSLFACFSICTPVSSSSSPPVCVSWLHFFLLDSSV